MLVLFSGALQIACDRLAAPGVAAAEDDCKALLFPACRCVLTAKCKQQLGEWQRRWLLCNQAVPLTKIPGLWTEPDYHNYRGRGLLWHLSDKPTWHLHLQFCQRIRQTQVLDPVLTITHRCYILCSFPLCLDNLLVIADAKHPVFSREY